jgi:dihydrolipoamide dehydrogenase
MLAKDGKFGPLTDPALKTRRALFNRDLSLVDDARDIQVRRDGAQAQVNYKSGGIEHMEFFEFVLAATGRQPRLDGLDLAAAGVRLDARGLPEFDRATGQIGDSAIFIAGDVSDAHPLLHEAADDGRIAGDNAGRFPDVRVRPRRAPLAIVFTDPQMMIAGASFRSLRTAGAEFEVGAVSFDDQGRSRVMAQNSGLLHVYGAHHTGRFLGAEMIGPAAEHIGHCSHGRCSSR